VVMEECREEKDWWVDDESSAERVTQYRIGSGAGPSYSGDFMHANNASIGIPLPASKPERWSQILECGRVAAIMRSVRRGVDR